MRALDRQPSSPAPMRRLLTLAPLALAVAACATRTTSVDSMPATPAAPAAASTATGTSIDVAAMAGARPAGSTLVVLVRHGEKAAAPAGDPSLSAEGSARAQALGALLRDVPVTTVVVTPTRRTNETATAAAQARGLTPESVGFGGGVPEHVNAVASAVRRNAGGIVLVVGHSNTVPAIVHALGGPVLPELCDPQYSQLFVLELPAAGGTPGLVRGTYGAPDRADAGTCAPSR